MDLDHLLLLLEPLRGADDLASLRLCPSYLQPHGVISFSCISSQILLSPPNTKLLIELHVGV